LQAAKDVENLLDEADQLVRILVASILTARRNAKARAKNRRISNSSIVNRQSSIVND
jgi:hypothetical protein